ncbi:hypothetical protein SCLCIDRAFT_992916 [Scleroderma citrinum Foug A]|uniref:Uncharacterized protein n=1 Tax=Scleroderma citrinum Foug A TaxID=1036808 RepID=A0A0C3DU69_9AGAM|nr:hypothetical protein SCLCIDRAFT_992916 [Scleroderma citrinum Foug A]
MSCKTEDGQGVNQLQRWISLSAYEIQVYTTSTEANIIIPPVTGHRVALPGENPDRRRGFQACPDVIWIICREGKGCLYLQWSHFFRRCNGLKFRTKNHPFLTGSLRYSILRTVWFLACRFPWYQRQPFGFSRALGLIRITIISWI